MLKLKNLRLITVVSLLFIMMSLTRCQSNKDVSGIWEGNIIELKETSETKDGKEAKEAKEGEKSKETTEKNEPQPTPVEALLSQNGTTVNGTLTLALPSQKKKVDATISAGVFTDGQLTFKANTNGFGARLGLEFSGEMRGDKITGKGTLTFHGMFDTSSRPCTLELSKKK